MKDCIIIDVRECYPVTDVSGKYNYQKEDQTNFFNFVRKV